MNEYKDLIETAIDGVISQDELIKYIIENGGDEQLLTKLGYTNVRMSKIIKTAGVLDFLKKQYKNNTAVMTGIIALLIGSGVLFSYQAMKNDDFNSIARKTNCSVQELKDLNPHLDNKINKGDNVVIPTPIEEDNYYALQRGDTLSHIANYLNISLDELLNMNPQIDKNKLNKLQIGQLINIGQHDVPKSVRQKTNVNPSNGTLNIDAALKALREIESSNGADVIGDGGKAIGDYQLWEIFVKDYHRLGGRKDYRCHVVDGVAQPDDVRWDRKKCEEIIRYVFRKYGYKNMEQILRGFGSGNSARPGWNKGVSDQKLQEYIDAYNKYNN